MEARDLGALRRVRSFAELLYARHQALERGLDGFKPPCGLSECGFPRAVHAVRCRCRRVRLLRCEGGPFVLIHGWKLRFPLLPFLFCVLRFGGTQGNAQL